MSEFHKRRIERLQSDPEKESNLLKKVTTIRRRLDTHVNTHIGYFKGSFNKDCHTCNGLSGLLRILESDLSLLRNIKNKE